MKLGLFKIIEKILEVIYWLDLPARMKIYLVQHIMILEPTQGNIKLLAYETDTGQEEDKQDVQKVISYKTINKQIQYKVKWTGYKETIQELEENLKNTKKKVKEYYKKVGQAKGKKIGQVGKDQLKGTWESLTGQEMLYAPLLGYLTLLLPLP